MKQFKQVRQELNEMNKAGKIGLAAAAVGGIGYNAALKHYRKKAAAPDYDHMGAFHKDYQPLPPSKAHIGGIKGAFKPRTPEAGKHLDRIERIYGTYNPFKLRRLAKKAERQGY
jgi:hypothetical protein